MRILSLKLLMAAAGVIAFFIMLSLAQEMNRRLQVQREITKLEKEASDLEKVVIEMESLNQYFRTEAWQERMAREKLNFRAEGEKVVLLPAEIEENQPAVSNNELVTEVSIRRRWWQVFFGEKNLL